MRISDWSSDVCSSDLFQCLLAYAACVVPCTIPTVLPLSEATVVSSVTPLGTIMRDGLEYSGTENRTCFLRCSVIVMPDRIASTFLALRAGMAPSKLILTHLHCALRCAQMASPSSISIPTILQIGRAQAELQSLMC